MIDLIVFSVATNKYALDIANIKRIIQAEALTTIPNKHPFIDGMMSHEDKVIKVLSFRKLIGLISYDEELEVLFKKLKGAHGAWVDALKIAVNTKSEFTKTTNPHMCELGKWIDAFTSYDDSIAAIFNNLVENHKQLHHKGQDILDLSQINELEAKRMLDVDINNIYSKTMGALDTFTVQLDSVANSLQKLIIYENGDKVFAIKVDEIYDIAHIQENQIMQSSDDDEGTEFLELEGVLDLKGTLINVIKTVKIPQ